MARTFLFMAALTVVLFATSVTAQTAIRCEVNGKVVYGDTACAPGSAAKAVAPTQETAEQKAVGKAASEQIRKDTAAIDKRLDDRYKRDTAHSTVRVAKPKSAGPRIIFDSTRKKGSASKSKSKAAKAAKSPKANAKKDNKSYRAAPKR